jgi:hypothetical protein
MEHLDHALAESDVMAPGCLESFGAQAGRYRGASLM